MLHAMRLFSLECGNAFEMSFRLRRDGGKHLFRSVYIVFLLRREYQRCDHRLKLVLEYSNFSRIKTLSFKRGIFRTENSN
jgi:hypothetical protein